MDYVSNICGMLTMRNQSWKVGRKLRSHLRKNLLSPTCFLWSINIYFLQSVGIWGRYSTFYRYVAAPGITWHWWPCGIPHIYSWLANNFIKHTLCSWPGQLLLVPCVHHALPYFLSFARNALPLLLHLESSYLGFGVQVKHCFLWEVFTGPQAGSSA